MKDGSHQRHSYPHDKALPRSVAGYSSVQKRVEKDMHHTKQRQHNRLVAPEALAEEAENDRLCGDEALGSGLD